MSDDLQVTPEADQIDVLKPACCPWRTALQVPLLLCAAAGLGFAGQHAWQNRGDFQSLLPKSSQCSQSYAVGCTSGGAHSQGCGAAALAASCAQAAANSCGSSATVVVEADEAVSALLPENLVDEL